MIVKVQIKFRKSFISKVLFNFISKGYLKRKLILKLVSLAMTF